MINQCSLKDENINCDRMLPVYKIKGKFYFRDSRLEEYRNIKDFMDAIPFSKFPKLEKPSLKDSKKVEKLLFGGGNG